MTKLIRTLTVSGGVGALFTSAIVLAQAAKTTGQAPVGTLTVTQTVEVKTVAKGAIQQPAAPQGAIVIEAAPKGKKMRGQAVRVLRQPNREPLVQQSKTQVRPAVRAELILALRVCNLSAEELRRINRDAQEVVSDVIGKVVEAQVQPRVMVQKGPVRNTLDGAKLLQDGLAVVMKKNLTPEQWSKYEVERDKRDAYRKQSTLRFLTGVVDRELFLSPKQRTELQKALNSNWDNGWQLYVDYLLYGNQFFPMNLDPLLNPILSDAQKKVWQNVQKVDGFWGFGGVWGGFGNDSDELEEELGEAKREPASIPGMRIPEIRDALEKRP
jgi:hypothetical protein